MGIVVFRAHHAKQLAFHKEYRNNLKIHIINMIATFRKRLLSFYVKYHCGCHLCLISIQCCFVSIITDDALSV